MRPAHSTMNPSLSLTLAAVLTLLAAVAPAADRSPNVVLILCDNLGYGDIQVTNPAAKQPTPQLKRLAEEGTFFSHAYCAATVCTPSRAALQTGCYPRRVGLDRVPVEKGNGHVLTPVSKYGLHPDEITLAELLRPAGIWFEPESLMRLKLKDDDLHLQESKEHRADFLNSIRTRKDPVSNVHATHVASYLGLIAEIAARLETKLKWDPKKEQFIGNDEANQRLSRPMHNGWKL